MKKLYYTILFCTTLSIAFGQNDNKLVISVNKTTKSFVLPEKKTADFSKPITLSFNGDLPSDFNLIYDGAILTSKNGNDIVITANDDKADAITINFKTPTSKYKATTLSIANKKSDDGDDSSNELNKSYLHYYNEFTQKTATYDRNGNKAYYYFDEKGLLLSLAPVNVDADDYLVVSMIVPENNKISIQLVGEYNSTDLSIRPYQALNTITMAQEGEDKERVNYIIITRTFGPFTSDKATIKFFDDTTELPNTLDVRINKLFNVAIGASFISTDLEKPEFDVFQIPGTANNTINTVNGGKRTLATFNVIFYWKASVDWAIGKLKGNSHITRGRDILKEATFWERLNPTFGVAINNEWDENFFFGGNFEFTRGGSISAGWHYGKVQELADSNFQLGTDVYTGTKEDIKLTDTWKTGFFFGITLDTRIFNKILSRN